MKGELEKIESGAILEIGSDEELDFNDPPSVEGYDSFVSTTERTIAAGKRLRREHNEHAWLAWTTAALTRTAKKLPDLKKLQVHEKKQRASVESDLAAAMAWNAAVNGDA